MHVDKYALAGRAERVNDELSARFGGMSNARRSRGEMHMAAQSTRSYRWLFALSAAVAVASIAVILWELRAQPSATARSPGPDVPPAAEESAISVKTIHPRRDASFQVTVEQPAYVEAYYTSDLMAQVAGRIKFLEAAIGDRVKADELLVSIKVPDLEEDVRQKESIVKQRQEELALAQAFKKTAKAEVEFAKAIIPEKESDRQRTESIRSFREKELRRFEGLAAGNSPGVTKDIVDERTQFYEAAVADVKAADAAVQKAKVGLSQAEAKLDAAGADVNLKKALVDVARRDLDRARALLSYASITAPFDGVVTRRNVDPGAFVQNAASARTEPMLTVARTDIVTVYMKLPDNYAPYVTRDTEAVIEMSVLPGWKIRGKVTRYSPSLVTPEHDRTMRVEVDLFNGSAEDYRRLLDKAKDTNNEGLKGRTLPVFPTVNGKPSVGLEGRLLPGMFGTMRLTLQKFTDTWLVPSTAVVSEGGRSYLYLVKDDKAARVPVEVQVDDGRLAKVVLIETVAGQQVRRALSGDETVVVSNQGELSDGQAVKATPSTW